MITTLTPPRSAVTRISLNRASPFARQLVGWWPAANRSTWGAQTWRDATANTSDLTYSGTTFDANAFRAAAGRLGWRNALSDATDYWEGDPSPRLIVDGEASVTWSVWFAFPGGLQYSQNNIFMKRGGGAATYPPYALQIATATHTLKYIARTSSGVHAFSSDYELSDTDWHHVVGRYRDSTAQMWVDGVEVALSSNTGGETLVDGAYPMLIGVGYWYGPETPSEAIIDDLRVWKRALTAPEIAQLYRETRGGGYGSLATEHRPMGRPAEGAAAVAQSAPIILATTQAGL